jgi:hypothetical protein
VRALTRVILILPERSAPLVESCGLLPLLAGLMAMAAPAHMRGPMLRGADGNALMDAFAPDAVLDAAARTSENSALLEDLLALAGVLLPQPIPVDAGPADD